MLYTPTVRGGNYASHIHWLQEQTTPSCTPGVCSSSQWASTHPKHGCPSPQINFPLTFTQPPGEPWSVSYSNQAHDYTPECDQSHSFPSCDQGYGSHHYMWRYQVPQVQQPKWNYPILWLVCACRSGNTKQQWLIWWQRQQCQWYPRACLKKGQQTLRMRTKKSQWIPTAHLRRLRSRWQQVWWRRRWRRRY